MFVCMCGGVIGFFGGVSGWGGLWTASVTLWLDGPTEAEHLEEVD